jgi:uncharacterized repeat protein (TIGR01451 family)
VHAVSVSDNKISSVSCPAGNVAPGASVTCTATYTVTQVDVNGGSVTNTAYASAVDPQGDTLISNSSSVTVNASGATSSISLMKSTTSSGYSAAGNTIPYSYLVTNTGTTTLHGVSVADNKIASVNCPSGNVAPGGSVTCTASYTATEADVDAGSLTNTATAVATDPHSNTLTSNSSSVTVPAVAVTSLSLVKSAGVSSFVGTGATIPYGYLVTNTGTTTLQGVSVSDNLVASVSCPSGALAPGASVTCAGSYTTTSVDMDAGSVSNTATATANDAHSNTVTSNASTVTVPEGMAITSAASTSATEGVPAAFTVTTTSGPNKPTISDNGSMLPAGLAFADNGDGTASLTGTPACGTAGTYPLSISATNGAGSPATQTLSLVVATAPSAKPSFTSAGSANATLGTPFTFTVTASCNPLPSISMTTTNGISLTDNHNGTATLSGTPTTSGISTLPIIASNYLGLTAQNFTLTVQAVPAFTSAKTVAETTGVAFSFTVKTSGYPAPAITAVSTPPLPSGVTLVDQGNGTAILSGTAPVGTSGLYNIALTAINGVDPPGTQTLALSMNEVPAITSGNSVSVQRGVAMTAFVVTTTGYPVPTVTATGLPTGLSVKTVNGQKVISGTPAAGDALGAYAVTITASNSKGTATQAFSLTLTS